MFLEAIGMSFIAISIIVGLTFITATISAKFWDKLAQIQMERIITAEEEEKDNE